MSVPAVPDKWLAQAILSERHREKLTQEEAAHRAGLTVAAWSRIELGKANPTWTTVRRIAVALGVRPQYLVGLAETLRDGQE